MIVPEELERGDFLLVRTNHFVSRLIRFGQRGYGSDCARWNHVALYIGDGRIVEALTSGVCENSAAKYAPEQVRYVPVATRSPTYRRLAITSTADCIMRANAVAFARSCVGERYGYATIAAIALKVITKGRLQFGISGTSICSGLVARSLERMGYCFNPWDPAELTPAYLAKTFEKD